MPDDPFRRKSDEEIMQEISSLKKGRLKIYIGAGSKTGKTHHMLHDGQDLFESGVDVVMSAISTQESLRTFCPVMPTAGSDNSDEAGDLDVRLLLARSPEVLLVDNLAHVNRPPVMFATRLDDVRVLLDHGIHVMTTLNIYDIEELRPEIKRLTGIEVEQTVPMSALAQAHEIKLVDVDPEAVLKRLQDKDGDGEGSGVAINEDALSILRELTLRLIADDVNNRLEEYRNTHGIQDSSAAAEKILVALRYNSGGTLLIRRGQQIANRLNGELHLLTIVDPRKKLSVEETAFKDAVSRLAHKINAVLIEDRAEDAPSVAGSIALYARTHHITRIVIGQSRRSRWEEITKGSIVNHLMDSAKEIDLMVIADRHSVDGERLLSYRQRSRNAASFAAIKQEDLSKALSQLKRGRFKIYIGAAPGVGKTYTMLEEAKDLRAREIDVVGGIIETHNRAGTRAKVADLEVLDRKRITYAGSSFEEMDLEGILRRNPEVVLVDELAHTNIIGSKHKKRYEDVEEILAAGISVISTVNVQHLESLHDPILQLTGVKVRETIPDYILRMADEVVLIDVPPETLQQRMREGKIYAIEKAEQALANFFRHGNLIALRELALREVADHIDDRLESQDDRSALRGPWRRMEIVYVCVNTKLKAEFLIRRGFRTAHRMKAKLLVSYVQETAALAEEELACLENLKGLTRRLGGEFIHLRAPSAREIVNLLTADMEARLATQVVVGHSSRSKQEIRRRGHTLRNLLHAIRSLDVIIIAVDPLQ